MPRINLLPWREELRQQRQRKFTQGMLLVMLAAILFIVGLAQLIKQQQHAQESRNQFILLQIGLQNNEIKEVQALKKQRDTLLAWVDIVHQLQSNRGVIVNQLNLLAHSVVDDLYFTSIKQTGGILTLEGEAKTNRQISDLMRQLAQSEIMNEPLLTDVSASRINPGFSQFTLQIVQQRPEKGATQ